jgi:hypothetical protein
MIKLAENSITLTGIEGTTSAFDPDYLQARIIQSFITAGISESHLAEDISLAVEFSLRKSNRKEKNFTISEVNNIVARIMMDTGFPEVAAIYLRNNASSQMTIDPEFNTIKKLLQKHLGINNTKIDSLCGKVIAALGQLNIKDAAPGLFLELAKHYEMEAFADDAIEPVALDTWEQDNHWLVTAKQLEQELAISARNLINSKVIRLAGVSSMFPSIRIFFMINEFCRFHGFEGPLTEMVLIPYLFSAGKAIDSCIKTTELLASEEVQGELPVFLTIPDMSSFAVQMLNASWPEVEKDCREMMTPLCNSLSRPLFKLKLS